MRTQAPREVRQDHPGHTPPSPDTLRKLDLSRQRAETVQTREMHCPICGFLVQIIPVTQTELVFVRCRKCKFTGPLDPAYFRRMRRLAAYRTRIGEYGRRNKR